jgi:hypothetical protein
MKKISSIAVALALLLSGCAQASSDNSQSVNMGTSGAQASAPVASKRAPLELVKTGYQVKVVLGTVMVYWQAIVKNPNTDSTGQFIKLRLSEFAADGSVVGTSDQDLNTIGPGELKAWANVDLPSAKPAKVEISLVGNDWLDGSFTAADYPAFTFDKVKTAPADSGFQTSGLVTNHFKVKVSQTRVTVLFEDASGKLIGGDESFVNEIASGSNAPFQITVDSQVKPASVIVFGDNWDY